VVSQNASSMGAYRHEPSRANVSMNLRNYHRWARNGFWSQYQHYNSRASRSPRPRSFKAGRSWRHVADVCGSGCPPRLGCLKFRRDPGRRVSPRWNKYRDSFRSTQSRGPPIIIADLVTCSRTTERRKNTAQVHGGQYYHSVLDHTRWRGSFKSITGRMRTTQLRRGAEAGGVDKRGGVSRLEPAVTPAR